MSLQILIKLRNICVHPNLAEVDSQQQLVGTAVVQRQCPDSPGNQQLLLGSYSSSRGGVLKLLLSINFDKKT